MIESFINGESYRKVEYMVAIKSECSNKWFPLYKGDEASARKYIENIKKHTNTNLELGLFEYATVECIVEMVI